MQEKKKLKYRSGDEDKRRSHVKANALAGRIIAGEDDLKPELWKVVQKFCMWYCRHVFIGLPKSFQLEYDDLTQCGYIAMCDALQRFDPERDGSFVSLYMFCLQAAIYRENGLDRGGHYADGSRRFDPVIDPKAYHLDSNTDDSGEKDGSLLDILPLPEERHESISSAEGRIFQSELTKAIEQLIKELPSAERQMIRARYYAQRDRKSIAQELHITKDAAIRLEDRALMLLRQHGTKVGLEQFLDGEINLYAGTGLQAFKESGSSATERHAIRRMELENTFRKAIEKSNLSPC